MIILKLNDDEAEYLRAILSKRFKKHAPNLYIEASLLSKLVKQRKERT